MRLIEACCGSAALTYHLLGVRQRVVGYQGGKWRYREQLADFLGVVPDEYLLVDPGPWGVVAGALLDASIRVRIVEHLRQLVSVDARELFTALNGRAVPADAGAYAAEFLWLQAMAFSQKAVGDRGLRWSSPGLDACRPGRRRTDLPALWGIEAMTVDITGTSLRMSAEQIEVEPGDVVYIDPPYHGTTGYPGGSLPRSAVVALARRWDAFGADVIISEAEPIHELGWYYAGLSTPDRSGQRKKATEYLTMSKAPAQLGLL